MQATTKTGNKVTFDGNKATINGVTFPVVKTATGVKSSRMVEVGAKSHWIDMAFDADLAAVHFHLDSAMAQVKAEYENSGEAFTARIYATA